MPYQLRNAYKHTQSNGFSTDLRAIDKNVGNSGLDKQVHQENTDKNNLKTINANTRNGHVLSGRNNDDLISAVTESDKNGEIVDHDTVQCSVYFNGGCYFDLDNDSPNVTVISRYLDLPHLSPAIVRCTCNQGVAVLCGPHIEYDALDIDDGDKLVEHMLPELEMAKPLKEHLMKCLLTDLKIAVK